MWSWRRVGLVVASLPLASLACNALSGASDLTVTSSCEGCTDLDARSSVGDEKSVAEASAEGGGSIDAGADVTTRPPFCEGIVMYLRFDDTLTTSQGINPESPPAAAFVPGHFGSGALLTGNNTALYYVEGDGGVPYPKTEGSALMWLRPQWTFPTNVDRVVWKPVVDRSVNTFASGPSIRSRGAAPGFFGSTNNEPSGPASEDDVGGTGVELTPYWKSDWNHLAETWSQSSPTITFTLNGAEGDPSITHRETDAGWTPQGPTVAYIRISSNSVPSDAAYDDFALWNRSLSLLEVQAVYSAGRPLGELCGL